MAYTKSSPTNAVPGVSTKKKKTINQTLNQKLPGAPYRIPLPSVREAATANFTGRAAPLVPGLMSSVKTGAQQMAANQRGAGNLAATSIAKGGSQLLQDMGLWFGSPTPKQATTGNQYNRGVVDSVFDINPARARLQSIPPYTTGTTKAGEPPKTPTTNVPTRGVGGAVQPAPVSAAPEKSAATLQLEKEAENMAKYGNPFGPGGEMKTSQPANFAEAPPNDLTTYREPSGRNYGNDIQALIDARSSGLPTAQSIGSAEEVRRQQMADVIGSASQRQIAEQEKINQQQKQAYEQLGVNLSGGLGTVTETQTTGVRQAMERGAKEIANLQAAKLDALSANDVASAQRIEDRVSTLQTQLNDIANIATNRVSTAAGLGEQDRRFALERLNIESGIENAKLGQTNNTVQTLIQQYGSQAFKDLKPEQVAMLERRLDVPYGTLQREIKTIDEQDKTKAAAQKMEFISGTKNQKSGVFNPYTGTFTSLSDAYNASGDAEGASGLTQEEIDSLKTAYLTTPATDRANFVDSLSVKNRLVILTDPLLTTLYSAAPESAAAFVKTSNFLKANPDLDRVDTELGLLGEGVNPYDKDIQEALKNIKPSGFLWWKK